MEELAIAEFAIVLLLPEDLNAKIWLDVITAQLRSDKTLFLSMSVEFVVEMEHLA